MSAEVFVGMDVSQAAVDVAVHPGTAFQIAHDGRGIAQAVERLHALQPTLIVLEATDGLEVPLTGALAAAGLPVAVINPRQVRDLCPGDRAVGQDGSARCADPRPVRRSHSTPGPSGAR